MKFILGAFLVLSFLAVPQAGLGQPEGSSQPWFPAQEFEPTELGATVSKRLLNRPVKMNPEILKAIAGFKINGASNEAAALVQQGFFEYYTFNWVDAIRALKMALDSNPKLVEAQLALIGVYLELGLDIKYAHSLLNRAAENVAAGSYPAPILAWLEFTKFNVCAQDQDECQFNRHSDMYSQNITRDEMVRLSTDLYEKSISAQFTDLAVVALAQNWDRGLLEALLKQNPNHIGVNHYLTHLYENTGLYNEALAVAKKMAELAPNSAHSQHMYGHILPKLGRWKEAIVQFEKAEAIHQKWFNENEANIKEDWHYPHNIDLLAHAYNWSGNQDKAETLWIHLCKEFRGFYCSHLTYFLLAQGKVQKAKTFDMTERTMALGDAMDPEKRDGAFEVLKKILNLNRQDDVVKVAVAAIQYSKDKDERWVGLITKSVENKIKSPGFDSWSRQGLFADYLIKLAESLGAKNIAANLRIAKETSAFVCQTPEKK